MHGSGATRDPLADAKLQWEERRRKLEEQQQEEELRIGEMKKKRKERFKKKNLYQSRLQNGQPKMRYQIFDLLKKARQVVRGGDGSESSTRRGGTYGQGSDSDSDSGSSASDEDSSDEESSSADDDDEDDEQYDQ